MRVTMVTPNIKGEFDIERNNYIYGGGRLLQLMNKGELVATLTVNLNLNVTDDCVAIKNYSENVGVDTELIRLGIIEDNPIKIVRSGFVDIPVYRLTEKGLAI